MKIHGSSGTLIEASETSGSTEKPNGPLVRSRCLPRGSSAAAVRLPWPRYPPPKKSFRKNRKAASYSSPFLLLLSRLCASRTVGSSNKYLTVRTAATRDLGVRDGTREISIVTKSSWVPDGYRRFSFFFILPAFQSGDSSPGDEINEDSIRIRFTGLDLRGTRAYSRVARVTFVPAKQRPN